MCICDISVLMMSGCKCGSLQTPSTKIENLVAEILATEQILTNLYEKALINSAPITPFELDDVTKRVKKIRSQAGYTYFSLTVGVQDCLDALERLLSKYP